MDRASGRLGQQCISRVVPADIRTPTALPPFPVSPIGRDRRAIDDRGPIGPPGTRPRRPASRLGNFKNFWGGGLCMSSRYCDALSSFADQDAVRSRNGAGADAQQGVEGSMARPAPIEAEDELIEVVLEVGFPQSVIDAQAPTLEV